MHFYCIADAETVRGFRLAGVAGRAVTTPEEAAAALDEAVARPECGIVIMTEAVAAGIDAQVENLRQTRATPLIVELPGPGGPLAGRRGLRALVQEAVGISVGGGEEREHGHG